MSPESLPDLLAREADAAPHVVVAADTWRRGRRRRAAKVTGALLAVVAVIVGVAVAPSLLDRDRTLVPAGTSPAPGLPDHLHAPPERMSDQDESGTWVRDEVRSDLAVGRAAAAWVTPGGLPVVVDAETGEHHLLALPGSVAESALVRTYVPPDWQPLALSPDGTRLAYGTARVGRIARTGITVVDLETGEEEWSVPLGGDAGIVVTSLSWSRSGEWIGWQGSQLREWTESSLGGALPVAGVAGPAGTGPTIGVAGGGAVVTSDRAQAYVVEPGRIRAATYCPENNRAGAVCVGPSYRWSNRPALGLTPSAALSPDGSTLALSVDGYDLVTLPLTGVLTASGPPPIRVAPTIGAEGAPDDRPWSTTSLGWVDDTHVLVLRDPGDGSASRLAIVPADAEDGPSVDVGEVDAGVGTPSIAIDLVTLDRPTVDRPDPDWPWSEERWVLTSVLAGIGLVLLVGAAGVLLRRRRDPDLPRPRLGTTGRVVVGLLAAVSLAGHLVVLFGFWAITCGTLDDTGGPYPADASPQGAICFRDGGPPPLDLVAPTVLLLSWAVGVWLLRRGALAGGRLLAICLAAAVALPVAAGYALAAPRDTCSPEALAGEPPYSCDGP